MWEQIKRLMQKGGGKFIIIEENRPSYVILPIEEYENLLEQGQIEKANQDISEWKETNSQQPVIEETANKEKDEIKVEDLPF